jgi:hypothetical protein
MQLDDDSPAPAPALRQRQRARPQATTCCRLRTGDAAGARALQQPGRLRVDAERVRDTSVVSVFDGAPWSRAAAQLTVRAGRSAEVRDADVRTMAAVRTSLRRMGRDARPRTEDRRAHPLRDGPR